MDKGKARKLGYAGSIVAMVAVSALVVGVSYSMRVDAAEARAVAEINAAFAAQLEADDKAESVHAATEIRALVEAQAAAKVQAEAEAVAAAAVAAQAAADAAAAPAAAEAQAATDAALSTELPRQSAPAPSEWDSKIKVPFIRSDDPQNANGGDWDMSVCPGSASTGPDGNPYCD